jgi:hypothetical protein
MTALKNPPLPPDMFDAKFDKLWIPDDGSLMPLHDKWLEEWNKIYGYRQ